MDKKKIEEEINRAKKTIKDLENALSIHYIVLNAFQEELKHYDKNATK